MRVLRHRVHSPNQRRAAAYLWDSGVSTGNAEMSTDKPIRMTTLLGRFTPVTAETRAQPPALIARPPDQSSASPEVTHEIIAIVSSGGPDTLQDPTGDATVSSLYRLGEVDQQQAQRQGGTEGEREPQTNADANVPKTPSACEFTGVKSSGSVKREGEPDSPGGLLLHV